MRKFYLLVLIAMMACIGCQWQQRSSDDKNATKFSIVRFDQIEQRYLATGDFAALQQLQTGFPSETRTLIEDVLQIGRVDDPDINQRFYSFFQDSTLQVILTDVDSIYAEMSDVNRQLDKSFQRLCQMLPDISVPRVYTQIGSLDQSIIVSDSMLGISLDKYLGAEHPVYLRYGYSEEQRSMMTRDFIVPDCLGFYLLSLYPFSAEATADERHWHMAKIQHVVNKAIGRRIFTHDLVCQIEDFQRKHTDISTDSLLNLQSLDAI